MNVRKGLKQFNVLHRSKNLFAKFIYEQFLFQILYFPMSLPSTGCRRCLWNSTPVKCQLYAEDLFDSITNRFTQTYTNEKMCTSCSHLVIEQISSILVSRIEKEKMYQMFLKSSFSSIFSIRLEQAITSFFYLPGIPKTPSSITPTTRFKWRLMDHIPEDIIPILLSGKYQLF